MHYLHNLEPSLTKVSIYKKTANMAALSALFETCYTLITRVRSQTLVRFLYLQHKSLLHSLLCFFIITQPRATRFFSHHAIISSFIPKLALSLPLSLFLSLQWLVIKVVRAILLPEGWETYSKAPEIKMKTN